jgi:hypothetical protein
MLDISISYNRFKFLGFEFLTWLWFSIDQPESHSNSLRELDGLSVGNRILIENRRNNNLESITIKGQDTGIQTGLEEGMPALQKGAFVAEINLIYEEEKNRWQFTLKGDSLSICNIRHPDMGPIETYEDLDAYVFEKTHHISKIIEVTDTLFRQFIHARLSSRWQNEIVPRIKKWILS